MGESGGLRVEGISKRFGNQLAVNDLSFAVAPGEIDGQYGMVRVGCTQPLTRIEYLLGKWSGIGAHIVKQDIGGEMALGFGLWALGSGLSAWSAASDPGARAPTVIRCQLVRPAVLPAGA
jgi:hypothetical protein